MKISILIAVVIAAVGALSSSAARRVFSDAEIATVVAAANQGEIDAAALAENKASNADVKAFAEHMSKAHEDAKAKLEDVEGKAGLMATENEISAELKKKSVEEVSRLGSLTGDDFDRAYMNAMVADHTNFLKKLDQDLIPSAKDASLAALVRKLRPEVASHLNKAKRIQKRLESR
jgi:putative membrane protein